MQYKKILLFGDSITEFAFNSRIPLKPETDEFTFGSALTNSYIRRMDVIPRGFSGYTSRWALKLLPRILKAEKNIALALVFFGTNDASLGGTQAVPLDEFEQNIQKMVEMLFHINSKVILIGPGFHDAEKWAKWGSKDGCGTRTTEANRKYNEKLMQVSEQLGTGMVNLYDGFVEAGESWKDLLSDGIHYSGKGYKMMYDKVMAEIEARFPELLPESLAIQALLWRDIAKDGHNV